MCIVKTCTEEEIVGHPIQIVSINNNTIQLNRDKLNEILQAEDVKDRHVVVVSTVGMIRTGKSFLMNFFIRFLIAQVIF